MVILTQGKDNFSNVSPLQRFYADAVIRDAVERNTANVLFAVSFAAALLRIRAILALAAAVLAFPAARRRNLAA